jgi:hypothetical protein
MAAFIITYSLSTKLGRHNIAALADPISQHGTNLSLLLHPESSNLELAYNDPHPDLQAAPYHPHYYLS